MLTQEPRSCDLADELMEDRKVSEIVDTGLRTWILTQHQSAVSARLAVYYYGGKTFVASIEHYGESPGEDWCFEGIIPPNDIRDWYVAGVLEGFVLAP